MKNLFCLILSIGCALLTSPAIAAPPQTINYQGYLTSTAGAPVTDGVLMTFRLYNTESGGTAIWTGTEMLVPVANGAFSVVLGKNVPITLPFDVPYWLSVAINMDGEMAPRQPLMSSPYAFRARSADGVSSAATIAGSQITGTISPSNFPACGINEIYKFNGMTWVCAALAPGGSVTSVGTGSGLTGGPITGAGTIELAATQLLPTTPPCTANQIPKWSGSAWACMDYNGLPPGGLGGQVLGGDNASSGAPAWTSSPVIGGNLILNPSTATAGNIMKGATRFIHNFGTNNTFIGESAGNFNASMTGTGNTANGANTLSFNTTGNFNTAVGSVALMSNSTGAGNTASGVSALQSNTGGSNNTASGASALYRNTTGIENTASGINALYSNTIGESNTAGGAYALFSNTTGGFNVASGRSALHFNVTGGNNVAVGVNSLLNSTASNNIAIGNGAGANLTNGNDNIIIGHAGVAAEAGVIRIGTGGTQNKAFLAGIRGIAPGNADALPVVIDSAGQLGTASAASGTVTSITAGAGLTGGTITGSGTIALDPASPALTSNFVRQNGNALGTATTIGTTDNQPVILVVNGSAALQIIPSAGAPNLIGGYAGNSITAGVGAAVIAGGGAPGITNPLFGPCGSSCGNRVTDVGGTVSGGEANQAGDGAGTTIDHLHATVAGGFGNTASGQLSSIGGGRSNTASGTYSRIGGGGLNTSSGDSGTVGGGNSNSASSLNSTVGGGNHNAANSNYSTVGGGDSSTASGSYSTVGGGISNTASGFSSTVGGGYGNTASGAYSFAAGTQAKTQTAGVSPVIHNGAFVWADSHTLDFNSSAANEFSARATGGIRFVTAIDGAGAATRTTTIDTAGNFTTDGTIMGGALTVGAAATIGGNAVVGGNTNIGGAINFGATLRQMLNLWNTGYGIGVQNTSLYFRSDSDFQWFKLGTHANAARDPGAGGSWLMGLSSSGLSVNGTFVSASDRNAKENFAAIDPRAVLEKVAALPLESWNYRNDENKVRHLGPMAQDFHAAFGVGPDDKHIATVDEGGIALAAIQGLNAKLDERDAALRKLVREKDAEIAELKRQIPRIAALEQQSLELAELKAQTARLVRLLSRQDRADLRADARQ